MKNFDVNIDLEEKALKVAIVYQYLAHYRYAIAYDLSWQAGCHPEYTFVSGYSQKSDNSNLKTIDPLLSSREQRDGGIRWKLVKNYWLYKSMLWQSDVVRLSINKEFDVIIYLGDMHYISTWLGALLARMRGKRVLMWTHGYYGNEGTLKSLARRAFFSLAHGMLLYGTHARNIMIQIGFKPETLYVVYNSLDYKTQSTMRESLSKEQIYAMTSKLFSNPDLPAVIFSGRLIAQKGLTALIDSIALLHSAGVKTNLLIVGDGPEEERLSDYAKNCGLDDFVRFYGACYSEKELSVLFSLSAVCVSPEGVGLTAIHAMSYGVPVITHDNPVLQKPEFEAIVPGQTGDFFSRGNVEDLANKIRTWVEQTAKEESIFNNCLGVIELLFNTKTQLDIINSAVAGESAEELLQKYNVNAVKFTNN